MNGLNVKGIKRQTLNQRVYETIKASILVGDLMEGTKLSEQQMAASLGVSATPVREAFRMLATEGLVRIEPWKGAVVQGFTEADTLEAVQCREALECQALRLVFDQLTEEDFQHIEGLVDLARSTSSHSEFVRLSSSIHDVWIHGCKNRRLAAMMQQLDDVLLHDRNVSSVNADRTQQIIAEHTEILAALRAHDLPRATTALTAHIYNGYAFSIDSHRRQSAAR